MNKLTILVQVYKPNERFFDCLNALANQSDNNFDCVIMKHGDFESKVFDDAVNQYSKKIAAGARVVYEQVNKGPAYGRNRIVEYCDTEFFARVDCDDVIEKDFVLKVNMHINKGYELILLKTIKASEKRMKLEKEYNLPEGIMSVLWQPYAYIIKKSAFIKYPDSIPEDVGSVIYYINCFEEDKIIVANDIKWDLYSTLSNPKNFKKNLKSWKKGIKLSSNYWAKHTGKLNRIAYSYSRATYRISKFKYTHKWAKYFLKNGRVK